MADIELVIKMSKRVYNYIRKYEHIANSDVLDIKDAIINGTPLPKGHGRLIDADSLEDYIKEDADEWDKYALAYVEDAPTIIEADTESEVKNDT